MYQKAFSSLTALFHAVCHEGQHAVDILKMVMEMQLRKGHMIGIEEMMVRILSKV